MVVTQDTSLRESREKAGTCVINLVLRSLCVDTVYSSILAGDEIQQRLLSVTITRAKARPAYYRATNESKLAASRHYRMYYAIQHSRRFVQTAPVHVLPTYGTEIPRVEASNQASYVCNPLGQQHNVWR